MSFGISSFKERRLYMQWTVFWCTIIELWTQGFLGFRSCHCNDATVRGHP